MVPMVSIIESSAIVMLMQPNITIDNVDGLAFGVVSVVHSPCLPARPYLRPEMTLGGVWGKISICLSV